MKIYSKRWLAILWFVCCATSLFLITRSPITPRSWTTFVVLATPGVLLTAAALSRSISSHHPIILSATGVWISALVRISMFISVPYSGSDHVGLYQTVSEVLMTGEAPSGGFLYSYATHFPIGSAMIAAVTGLEPPELRFVSLVVSSMFPWMLAALFYEITRDGQVTILSGVIGSYFPLLLRTSALIEAEYMVLAFFLTLLFALRLTFKAPRSRKASLLVAGILSLAVFVHFFYALILLAITTASLCTWLIFKSHSKPHYQLTNPMLIGWFVTLIIILWSGYAEISVGTAVSSIFRASPSSGSSSLLSMLIPTSGTVAVGTGGGGGGGASLFTTIVQYLPVVITLVLAAIGGLILIYRNFGTSLIVISLSTVVVTLAVVIFSSGGMNVGFRAYYFVGLLAVGFAGVGAIVLRNISERPRIRQAISIFLVVAITIVTVIGPATPLGNNVDPKFSGTSFAIPQDPARFQVTDSLQELNKTCPTENATIVNTGKFVDCYRSQPAIHRTLAIEDSKLMSTRFLASVRIG